MRRILIVSHAMEIGGAERALLGMLEQFDTNQASVDLFLMRHEGELLKLIPKKIHLLPEIPQYTILARPIKDVLKEGHILLAGGRLIGKIQSKRYVRKHHIINSGVELEYSHKFTKRWMPFIEPEIEYDLAISFLTPHYFVAEKVNAKKRIAWIHTDYSAVQVDVTSELVMWSQYDWIVSISDAVTQSFVSIFPELNARIIQVENILSKQFIQAQSELFDASKEMPEGTIRLLSIGRFSLAKNFDNIPDICAKIRSFGLHVKWYLIGYGGEEKLIRRKIAEAHMEDYVIVLGKKENPYPYIKACDLYVQPSRYEGKCVAVREAQILCKPVVITDYETAASQLDDGIDGVIVPMDNAGCAKGIAELLKQPERMKQLSQACAERDYTNTKGMEKIYRLIDE